MGNEDQWEKLHKFMGSTEATLQGLNNSIQGVKEDIKCVDDKVSKVDEKVNRLTTKVDTLENDAVTKDICIDNRETCLEKKKQSEKDKATRKKWFDYIPVVVSALVLLGMLYTAFLHFEGRNNGIDKSTVQELKMIIKESKRDKDVRYKHRRVTPKNNN